MAGAPVTCPYCVKPAALVTGAVLYPGREDLAERKYWTCAPCGAHVGCHLGTENPLGRLADRRLRRTKRRAHAFFDPIWKRKMEVDGIGQGKARTAAYRWLARKLGLDPRECHIGMFDEQRCLRAIAICQPYAEALARNAARRRAAQAMAPAGAEA